MASWSTEFNKFFQLKTKVRFISADIYFLKECLKKQVFPKFIQNKFNSSIEKLVFKWKVNWLKFEIGKLHAKRTACEMNAYYLHLKLAKTSNTIIWQELLKKVETVINC